MQYIYHGKMSISLYCKELLKLQNKDLMKQSLGFLDSYRDLCLSLRKHSLWVLQFPFTSQKHV